VNAVNFKLKLFSNWRVPGGGYEPPGSLDAAVRQALAERVTRAGPPASAWPELRRRAEALRLPPWRLPPWLESAKAARRPKKSLSNSLFEGGFRAPEAVSTRLHVNAYLMTWRVPWGISLAACPLV
jgi:hypothetical protein